MQFGIHQLQLYPDVVTSDLVVQGHPTANRKMQRPVSSYAFAPSVKVKLLSAGFHSTADLCDLQPDQLSKEACISQEEAGDVLQVVRHGHVQQGAAEGKQTALELLEREQEFGAIVTFCSALDTALGGGLPVGKTMEVCGTPGIGKTQLCIQLAVDVQIPVCFGGLGGKALYIDTEGSFFVQRAVDLAQAAVEHCTLLTEDSEQREALKEFTVETVLSNLFFLRCHDYVELLAEMYFLPDFLARHPEIRLVVIDSVGSPFRYDLDDLSRRTRLLSGLSLQLFQMATNHNVAVVLTNQMTTKVWNGQSKLIPALGEIWGHAATQRLILHWEGTQRQATLYKSPRQRETTVPYQITVGGFRDLTLMDQPMNTTDPSTSQPMNTTDPSTSQSGSLSKRPRIKEDQSKT